MSVVNPPPFMQAGSYAAADDRRAIVSAWGQRSLLDTTNQGARGGFLPGKAPSWSVSGWNITVGQFTAVVENSFAVNAGDYEACNTANQTVTLTASTGTTSRIDIVGVREQDAFYSGSSNTGAVVVIQGTPSSGTPTAPSLPASFLPILQASVPSGSSTPTITDMRKSTSAAGGIPPVLSAQLSDPGSFYGEFRVRGTNGSGGLPYALKDVYGADNLWHGTQVFGLQRSRVSSGSITIPGTTSGNGDTPLFSVVIPDPGYQYFVHASGRIECNSPNSAGAFVFARVLLDSTSHTSSNTVMGGTGNWPTAVNLDGKVDLPGAVLGPYSGPHTLYLTAGANQAVVNPDDVFSYFSALVVPK